jgi:hypothetical protein
MTLAGNFGHYVTKRSTEHAVPRARHDKKHTQNADNNLFQLTALHCVKVIPTYSLIPTNVQFIIFYLIHAYVNK